MKKVFQSTDYYTAQLLKAYLHDCGIETTVNGELLMGAIGEIPANSYPTLFTRLIVQDFFLINPWKLGWKLYILLYPAGNDTRG